MVIPFFSVDFRVLSEFLHWLVVCVCVRACYEYLLSIVYTISLS